MLPFLNSFANSNMKRLLKAECLILISMKKSLLIILLIVIYSQIVLSACTDTDKGENLEVLGITSNNTKATYDRCSDLGRVNEGVCSNGAVVIRIRNCHIGETCSLGRCVSGENVPCADTDKGNNPDVIGIVTYNTDTLLIDRCNGLQLEENFCSGGRPWTQFIRCPNLLCINRKCKSRGGVQDGDAVQALQNVQTQEDWQPAPEAMPPEESYPCMVNEISWTDGYENNLVESGVGLTVYGLVTAENCEQEHFTLRVVNSADDSVVEDLGDFDFELNPDTQFWFNAGSWIPQAEREYYLSATIIRDNSYSYESDNSDRPLTVTNNCMPEPLPENIDCALDPVTGDSLASGQDLDCDGVDDCIDQWIYAYGDNVDPDTGIPVNLDCVSDWDCTQAEWGPCMNNNGRLTRTRDITQCTLPEGIACPTTPSDEKNCILEEQFPVFSLLNILTVSFMLIGYYFVKKRGKS